MFYIYILYSAKSDLYYVGYTTDFVRRLIQHNNSPNNTFTAKHRPWILKAVFESGNSLATAVKLERFIKKQKSKILLQQITDPESPPLKGALAPLVRVPNISG